ncbi:HMG-Y-related protein A [Elaeis guineensis]|uniref:HMG-Y-related protein A n=1 Tax=Elaeis guineensis var. tenera TaxID=51953 RepID=A0A6I9RU38_ELAGV|nr:HMG-Y-related protein A [Elaeis guineensis]
MATEEVTKPPNLPPYPEMILAAIAALNEKEGSSKSAISKYIESSYGELPQSHSSLLTAHLARMKESGELLLVKNNYLKPGPDAAPKRGRGRPPKPKPVLPPGTVLPPPRPRGRPPKPKDPLAVAVAKVNKGLPRARGRPPKKVRPAVSAAAAPASDGAPAKRGRGRPPKPKPVVANDEA